MKRVALSGNESDISALAEAANAMQRRYFFTAAGQDEDGAIPLRLSPLPGPELVTASRTLGVIVCTDQSDGISQYAGIPRALYLATASFLGLVYWRALDLNPLLIFEDFQVKEDSPGCICAQRERFCEYALAFEDPRLCRGCMEFFRCLGAESELLTLQEVLGQIRRSARKAFK